MAVTTSTSIREYKPTVCVRCKWPSTGLLVTDANGKPVHDRGECPDGVPPVEEALIAHDPFGPADATADARALAKLQEKGINFTRIAFRRPVTEPNRAVGDFVKVKPMRPVAEWVAEQTADGIAYPTEVEPLMALPEVGPTGSVRAPVAAQSAQKPLRAKGTTSAET